MTFAVDGILDPRNWCPLCRYRPLWKLYVLPEVRRITLSEDGEEIDVDPEELQRDEDPVEYFRDRAIVFPSQLHSYRERQYAREDLLYYAPSCKFEYSKNLDDIFEDSSE